MADNTVTQDHLEIASRCTWHIEVLADMALQASKEGKHDVELILQSVMPRILRLNGAAMAAITADETPEELRKRIDWE